MKKASDKIIVNGARQHNLKDIDVTIPRDQFVVITGLSGSGKSSLAFDTIYAEGQRRYVESLSSYARQFLGLMEKPDLDSIEGLSPAISIEQKSTARNPRSTVGTVTEIHDYLRLLYAHVGKPHCWKCGNVIQKQTVQQIVDRVNKFKLGSRMHILAPIVKGKKGLHKSIIENKPYLMHTCKAVNQVPRAAKFTISISFGSLVVPETCFTPVLAALFFIIKNSTICNTLSSLSLPSGTSPR